MDVVYVCREGKNEELRYSIRSVVANYESAGNVWVVGGKPDWYTGNFIPVRDTSTKFDNIKNCIKVAAKHPDISDDFVLMNDDFFILKTQTSLPLVHGDFLFQRINEYKRFVGANGYVMLLSRTYSALLKMGVENPIDYDIHTPMIMNKTKLLEVIDNHYSIRSWYGNIHNVGGIKIDDVKKYHSGLYSFRSYDEIDDENPYLSTEDGSFASVLPMLQEMFSEPSRYETI